MNVFVRINGETHYLWHADDHEGEVLEAYITKNRDKVAAVRFLKKAMKRYGQPNATVTDRLPSYRAAINEIENDHLQEVGKRPRHRGQRRQVQIRLTALLKLP